ncbi:MAG: peptidoglycan DD-metalloendopeptidase family protein [Erysipelotrichaceae bacterium]|nr:peptidoglycan DD-metalloendopeptidase family protein [Erysipelotrichaceae bacterium]
MKRKVLIILVSLCFALTSINLKPMKIVAEGSDDPYQFCNPQSEYYDKNRCTAYMTEQYENIRDIQNQINNARDNLEEAQKLATEYAQKADALNGEIEELTVKIDELVVKIDELVKSIEENEALVDELNTRVMGRMEESQKTMHFNEYLDFLLGAQGFDDLLRRIYGIKAIVEKEKNDRETLIDVINQLEKDKAELDESKAQLDKDREDVLKKQAEYIITQQYYQEIQEQTERDIENYQNALEDAKSSYADILDIADVSGIPSSEGFYSPVPGASISAGVWYYPASFGGGVHLGVDYAVGLGHSIYAPANGVIIVSADGCGTGYLGNSCGAGNGGVAYGGNQIYMITSVGGNVYALTFSHLLLGSPRAKGLVMAGEEIGKVGSSGNSTGPHCHIEMYYLGKGEMEDIENDYLYRKYSSSFNCGWGYSALNRLCENGVGAPCRLNPALYLGS